MNINIEITASANVLEAIHALARSLSMTSTPIGGEAGKDLERQITVEQLRETLIKISKEVGRNAINQLMEEFGHPWSHSVFVIRLQWLL